ncbi:MAG: hypothetical protein CM1200mP27_09950 [Chloroflexota bacterium]|nr:MAG: hypothetical protein CM1200mP27_09950 [Chloroflexota bacterium]
MAVGGIGGGTWPRLYVYGCRPRWPEIALQVLIYPGTDARSDTASYGRNAEGFLLPRRLWSGMGPILDNKDDATNPYAAPLRLRI